MIRLSQMAALTCASFIAIGTIGCKKSTTNVEKFETLATLAEADEACPVPEHVLQDITLDINKTQIAINTALISQDIAYGFADGSIGFYAESTQKPQAVSPLAEAITVKVKTLQENTAKVKKELVAGDGSVIYGEDIACDSGTYSADYNETYTEGEGSENETSRLTLSFDECVLEKNSANSELISFFTDTIMYNSVLNNLYYSADIEIYTFNGSLSLTYNRDYSYTDTSEPVIEPTNDTNDASTNNNVGQSNLLTNGLSMVYTVGGIVQETFSSSVRLAVSSMDNYESNNTTEFETVAAYNDGNYTRNYVSMSNNTLSIEFDGTEKYQSVGEDNETRELRAFCYTAELENSYSYNSQYVYSGGNYSGYSSSNNGENSIVTNGYIALGSSYNDEDTFVDLYGDGLSVNSSYEYSDTDIGYNESSTLSINGTMGSASINGRVDFDTQVTWLMSSEYNGFGGIRPRSDFRGGYYLPYTPYAGKTVLTSANTATVEFMFETIEEEPYTYGTITIEDEDPIRYDNVYELLGDTYYGDI